MQQDDTVEWTKSDVHTAHDDGWALMFLGKQPVIWGTRMSDKDAKAHVLRQAAEGHQPATKAVQLIVLWKARHHGG